MTEGAGIQRWFAPEAKVTPGLGSTIRLSWGPGMEGVAPITGWEPGKRFAWTEESGRTIAFPLEAAPGGGTSLCVMQFGMAPGSTLEKEVDAYSGGWESFLRLLQLDLAEYRGTAARHLCRVRMIPGHEPPRDRILKTIT